VDAYEIKIFALRAGEIKAEVLRIWGGAQLGVCWTT
jgi:hypothetical protein